MIRQHCRRGGVAREAAEVFGSKRQYCMVTVAEVEVRGPSEWRPAASRVGERAAFASLCQQLDQARHATVPDSGYLSEVTPLLRRSRRPTSYAGRATGRRGLPLSAGGPATAAPSRRAAEQVPAPVTSLSPVPTASND